MYTKEQTRQAFSSVFRGAGELWFPYAGRDENIDLPVGEHWQKLDAALGDSTPCDDPSVLLTASDPYVRLAHDVVQPPIPRILVIGARRFQRDASPQDTARWTWANMLRCPAMTPSRTPLAWRRLDDVGLQIADAVDLLPPGGEVDEGQAAMQARYLQGVLAGLEAAEQGYDIVVLLGGKVSKAFRAADSRLADLRLLELRHGFITVPTPHVVEQDAEGWWSNEGKLARLRDVVGKIMSWRCVECVNGDGEVQGCVECGTHAVGCSRGEFCVQCRRRVEVSS